MGLFEEMLDEERRKAFLEYRENKHIYDVRSQRMKDYLLSNRYEDDVRRLISGDYHISVPVKKEIPKGYTNRKRTVYHFEEDEMTLFRMMAFVLHDYDYFVSGNVWSFKKGTSVKDLILRISRDRELKKMHVVKADILSYGNSIDAERLIKNIHACLNDLDPEAVAFFSWLLRRKSFVQNGVLTEGDTSALAGCPIHNFFTNLYLVDTDSRITPRCELYARYSDDIIMFQRTKEEAEENMRLLLTELSEHHLSPHEDEKTGVYAPGEPFEYLGFSFEGDDVDIAGSSVKKLKRRMRIRAKKVGLDKNKRFRTPEEKAIHLIRLNRQTFFGKPGSNDLCWSRWTFPVITKTEHLHELDLYNQRCIRFALSGKWSDAQYRISYSSLKELGYASLVRAYHEYRTNVKLGKVSNMVE